MQQHHFSVGWLGDTWRKERISCFTKFNYGLFEILKSSFIIILPYNKLSSWRTFLRWKVGKSYDILDVKLRTFSFFYQLFEIDIF